MLNKKEVVIMREIYKRTVNNNGMCYVRPVDLLASLPYNVDINMDYLSQTLIELSYDDYYDLNEMTDANNEYIIQIKLKSKGFAFQRAEQQRIRSRKSSIINKIALTLLGVGLSVLIKFLIDLIKTH